MSKWLKVLDNPGDARPRLPLEGIPQQKLPHPIRLTVQWLLFPFVHLDVIVQAVFRFFVRPPHKREGACKMRGRCCRYLVQEKSFGKSIFPFFRWWLFEINGFYERDFEVDNDGGDPIVVYSCRHLQKNGQCGNYRLRPTICRTWPRSSYFGPSTLVKGCGFRLVPRGGQNNS